MKYLLDTNICIYTIRQQPKRVLTRFQECEVGEIGISSITTAELWYGVEKSTQKEQNKEALSKFLFPLEIAPFDTNSAEAYGAIRAELETKGVSIGALDLLIAAQAVSQGAVLVSNNKGEFKRIPRLQLENWAAK